MSWDTVFVFAIIGIAAVYIISRFVRNKGLGCSSCPGNCSGTDSKDVCKACPMAQHTIKKDEKKDASDT